MPFYVLKGDLVEMNVDAIVNAANVKLKMVEGVGRAIFHKAGDSELQSACNKIGSCNVGDCKVTPSFNISNITPLATRFSIVTKELIFKISNAEWE